MKTYIVQQIYIPPQELAKMIKRGELFDRKAIYGPILAEFPTREEAKIFFDEKTVSGTYCILYSEEANEKLQTDREYKEGI